MHISRRLNLLTFVLAIFATVFATPQSIGATAAATNADWPTYLGDKERSHYSPLRQINRSNVTQLKIAWTYDTGEKGRVSG
jgi:quinoprotein glucose dehydrogenase